MDLARVRDFSNSSSKDSKIITKVIPPASFSIIAHIRKNDIIDGFEEASDEEGRSGAQPTKLDIDFKHKRLNN